MKSLLDLQYNRTSTNVFVKYVSHNSTCVFKLLTCLPNKRLSAYLSNTPVLGTFVVNKSKQLFRVL